MQHALRAALDLTVLAVLIAFSCQWATLGLGYEAEAASPLALLEAAPAAPAEDAPAEPAPARAPEGGFILLAGLND